jgi:hypothetical protein
LKTSPQLPTAGIFFARDLPTKCCLSNSDSTVISYLYSGIDAADLAFT